MGAGTTAHSPCVLSFILYTGASNPHSNSRDSVIIPVYPTLRFLFFPLNHTIPFKRINMRPAIPLCVDDELISRPAAALPNFHFVQTVLFDHLPAMPTSTARITPFPPSPLQDTFAGLTSRDTPHTFPPQPALPEIHKLSTC